MPCHPVDTRPDSWLQQGTLPVYIAAPYCYPVDSLIMGYKYQQQLMYQSVLAELILRRLPVGPQGYPFDWSAGIGLQPMPTTVGRLRSRGFDTMRLIASHLARRWQLPLLDNLQRQDQGNWRQQSLSRSERLAHQMQFTVTGALPTHVLLLDDVLTTGRTLSQAAAALQQAGCQVTAVVIASNRQVRHASMAADLMVNGQPPVTP